MLDIRKSSAVLSKYISTKDKLSLDSVSNKKKNNTVQTLLNTGEAGGFYGGEPSSRMVC